MNDSTSIGGPPTTGQEPYSTPPASSPEDHSEARHRLETQLAEQEAERLYLETLSEAAEAARICELEKEDPSRSLRRMEWTVKGERSLPSTSVGAAWKLLTDKMKEISFTKVELNREVRRYWHARGK